MKMKIILTVISFAFLLWLTPTPSYAGSFSDNFNDGNADGWWLGYSHHTPWVNGNWRVEDGKLVQDQPGDDFNALLEGVQLSSQAVSVDLYTNPSGYGGITIWYKDNLNRTQVFLYPVASLIAVSEVVNGTFQSKTYSYTSSDVTWYNLKIVADSVSGNLDVYINNVYLFTHTATTTNRTGQSGVVNGNAGGYFDNFSITSDSIIDPLTNKEQCKNYGWKVFTNPSFKNQGACVSYIESNNKK